MSSEGVIQSIRSKLEECGGRADIPLQRRGCSFVAELAFDGVRVSNLGTQPLLQWEVFAEVVSLLVRHGGVCAKGDAMKGRLGDSRLQLDSVEGHVAHVVFGNQVGDSVFRRISPIAALLEWAGICENKRGELRLIDGGRSS